jgi:hypothetical protein
MPGRKVTPKAVAAAGEAAAKVNPAKVAPTAAPNQASDSSATKVKPQKQNDSAPKKEVQYVEYHVGEKKNTPTPTRKPKKPEDFSMLNKSLTDSAVAKAQKGKNVKRLVVKKQPVLPHHHGGKPSTKPVVPIQAE